MRRRERIVMPQFPSLHHNVQTELRLGCINFFDNTCYRDTRKSCCACARWGQTKRSPPPPPPFLLACNITSGFCVVDQPEIDPLFHQAQDAMRRTPLHWAARRGQSDCVQVCQHEFTKSHVSNMMTTNTKIRRVST